MDTQIEQRKQEKGGPGSREGGGGGRADGKIYVKP
jgi:hypothetical protein